MGLGRMSPAPPEGEFKTSGRGERTKNGEEGSKKG